VIVESANDLYKQLQDATEEWKKAADEAAKAFTDEVYPVYLKPMQDANAAWEKREQLYHRYEEARKMPQPDPVLVAAKALLEFLENQGTTDVCTDTTEGREMWLELDKFGLCAFPDEALQKHQDALEEAIRQAEGRE
jgi:phosphoglycolate phosphatase-like HAD superfamily hydrolase